MNKPLHDSAIPPGGERAAAPALAGLADLSPAYFAMVMATGIVSLAAHLHGLHTVATALFRINVAAWVVLLLLYVLRMVRHPRRFLGDVVDHLRGPGFFTTVAGTAVLGSQFAMLAADDRLAVALWVVAVGLWTGFTYTIFIAFTIKKDKPTLDRGITGAWLLAVVSTQSLAVLSALLAAHAGQPWKLELNFFALSMWLWGGMVYIWMMSLIFYRYTFFSFSVDDLAPSYWINM
jgi:tellurite resistance protein TehA-like permease